MSGPILGTFVFGALLKSWWHRGLRPRLHYYRDKDGAAVDFVFVQDERAYPVEMRKSASPGKESFKAFASLERAGLPIQNGGIICFCP